MLKLDEAMSGEHIFAECSTSTAIFIAKLNNRAISGSHQPWMFESSQLVPLHFWSGSRAHDDHDDASRKQNASKCENTS